MKRADGRRAERGVPTESALTPVVFTWWMPTTWPAALAASWRHSLRFRTLVVTIAATAAAILIAGVWMSLAIQNDLFSSRRDEVLADSQRATAAAQETIDAADVQGDAVRLENLMQRVRIELSQRSASDRIAALRVDDTPSSIAPINFSSPGLPLSTISEGLRERVAAAPDAQWWQSVTFSGPDGRDLPGIVVGQQISVPYVGGYELYLAYDLSAASQTLTFVQRTLWIVGAALLVLVGAIAWFVLRTVVTPVVRAADTSAQVAAGDLEVRLPVHGEDELATLGRSFNAMADSIQAQIEELAELSLVQQRFVSDVSHELRTPLTTIRLAADMINDQRAGFEPATARAAELMHAQVQRFETLLTDLLEISRYDAGSVQLEREAVSVAALAADVVAQMAPLADQHHTDVRLVAPGGYSPVEVDPRRIRRVLRNLLGNAIEHGEGRPIVVTVDSDQNAVAVGVRDFGLGMSDEDSERVFDRFWRADPSRKRSIGGTGLGLSIALGDARLHGGMLAVWSELGQGTNFVLTLPRRPGSIARSSPISLQPEQDSVSTLESLGATEPIDLIDAPPVGADEQRAPAHLGGAQDER